MLEVDHLQLWFLSVLGSKGVWLQSMLCWPTVSTIHHDLLTDVILLLFQFPIVHHSWEDFESLYQQRHLFPGRRDDQNCLACLLELLTTCMQWQNLPGMCKIVKWYQSIRRQNRWTRSWSSLSHFVLKRGTSGLWSVWMWNLRPIR